MLINIIGNNISSFGQGGGEIVYAPFIFKVSVSNGQTITLPYYVDGSYTGNIDWGDSNSSTNSYANRQHTYTTGGVYIVTISGLVKKFSFVSLTEAERLYITEIVSWGDFEPSSVGSTFIKCTNLDCRTTTDYLKIKSDTNLTSFFQDCNQAIFTSVNNITSWELNNLVTYKTLSKMFLNCLNFNQSINSWNVSNITNMSYLFASDVLGYHQFNQSLSSWDVSNVTDMSFMFSASSFNQPLSTWDVSNVTTMDSMFLANNAFSQNLSNWNVSNVTSFNSMFQLSVFNFAINWTMGLNPTINVVLTNMFRENIVFNQAINSWNTSRVTDMTRTFGQALSFNQTLSLWDTSNVTSMREMFRGTSATVKATFNQNISSWNTSNVTDMGSMFLYGNFNNGGASLNTWDTSKVTNMGNMFNANPFNQSIRNWNTSSVTTMASMFQSATSFNQDVGLWDVSKVTNMTQMFNIASAFNNAGTSSIGSWNTINVTNMSQMFQQATTFNQNIGAWNISKVTTIQAMFNQASAFNNGGSASIGSWNTSNIQTINQTFRSSPFNQPIGSWNTSNVTNMSATFQSNLAFNQNISGWDTSKSTTFLNTFNGATAFNQNIGTWNVSACLTFQAMFLGATSFNNGGSNTINNWSIYNGASNVSMLQMFQSATAFNQPINNWVISRVNNFSNFMANKTNLNYSASNLDAIYNTWSTISRIANLSISFGTIKYTAGGSAGRAVLVSTPWTITDGGI